MVNRILENYKEINKLRARKKIKKIICPNCNGNGYGGETYPKSECEICNGNRFIIEEENNAI